MFCFWHVSGTLVHPIVVECLFPVSVTQSVCGLRVTGCRLSRLISHLLSPYLHQDTVILTHQSWSLEANYKTLPYTYHDQYQLRSSIISLQQTIFLQLYYPVCLSIFCIFVWSGCTSLPLDSRYSEMLDGYNLGICFFSYTFMQGLLKDAGSRDNDVCGSFTQHLASECWGSSRESFGQTL